MQCPKCNEKLSLWDWDDDPYSYRGLICNFCRYSVWSDTIRDQIAELIVDVKQNYISSLEVLPDDADELPPWLQDMYLNRCTEDERQDLYKLITTEEEALLRAKGRI